MPATTEMLSAGVSVGAMLAMDWPMVSGRLSAPCRSCAFSGMTTVSVMATIFFSRAFDGELRLLDRRREVLAPPAEEAAITFNLYAICVP